MKSWNVLVMEVLNKANIFSIKRFAIHDGQGLRTTIFMKGCNLRCVWCHNPEGLDMQPQYQILSRCIQCNRCKEIDTDNRIHSKDGTYSITGSQSVQKYQDVCIMDAFELDCQQLTINQVIKEIEADQVFYRNNGGVTFSGGEPLLQQPFLLELLPLLKQKGIHCAMETALNIPYSKLEELLPYLDQIYIDLKLVDDIKHIEYTGVSNSFIKQNITKLLQSKYAFKVTIRTPLIPLYTATIDNIENIACFLSKHNKETNYELLNYNPLAIQKYQDLSIPFCFEENKPMYSKEEMKLFQNIAKKYLINVSI